MISQSLIDKVDPSWWESEEGKMFKREAEAVEAWEKLLGRFGYNCFFTLTFRDPATSSILAIDRAQKLLKSFFKSQKHYLAAFVVAEQHKSGTYHIHGLLKIEDRKTDIGMDLVLTRLWEYGFSKYGRCSFQHIKDEERVRKYCAKYLVKRLCDHRFLGRIEKSIRIPELIVGS